MSAARYTIARSAADARAVVDEAVKQGQTVVDGFTLPAVPWTIEALCVGGVETDAAAEDALLAAVHGAALLIFPLAPEPFADRLIDDLARLGRVAFLETNSKQQLLTGDERRLLALLAAGHSLDEAAQLAHLSRRTAERRLAALREKLGVSTTAEAVLAASGRGLLESIGGD